MNPVPMENEDEKARWNPVHYICIDFTLNNRYDYMQTELGKTEKLQPSFVQALLHVLCTIMGWVTHIRNFYLALLLLE